MFIYAVKSLYIVETVDTVKLANSLNKNAPNFGYSPEKPLNVLAQVNTSGEESMM
jgi:uncharacterized pyridoxal phosphate-containing UPF0001 family protein